MNKLLVMTLFFLCVTCTAADKPAGAIDEFRGNTQYQVLLCTINYKLTVSKMELGQSLDGEISPGECIKKGKDQAKPLFVKALSKVSKKPAAAKLLKDYYAAWISAINGILPGTSEMVISYNKRQMDLEASYDAIWNRFEIEAGI